MPLRCHPLYPLLLTYLLLTISETGQGGQRLEVKAQGTPYVQSNHWSTANTVYSPTYTDQKMSWKDKITNQIQ